MLLCSSTSFFFGSWWWFATLVISDSYPLFFLFFARPSDIQALFPPKRHVWLSFVSLLPPLFLSGTALVLGYASDYTFSPASFFSLFPNSCVYTDLVSLLPQFAFSGDKRQGWPLSPRFFVLRHVPRRALPLVMCISSLSFSFLGFH